jgi:hypothetical protein
MDDLIRRYVAAVGRQLPAKQAADIQAELMDELASRVEEREAQLGRPLTRADVEALLVEFGNPLLVAGRYRKTQHLIGPEVFPFWWATLKVVFLIALVAYAGTVAVNLALDRPAEELKQVVPPVAIVVVYLFGLITLVFAAFERFGKTTWLLDWKPARLPPARGKRRSRFDLGLDAVMNLIFLAWWFGLIHFRDLIPAPQQQAVWVEMAPVWAAWRWPIAVYSAWQIAADVVGVVRPDRVRLYTGLVIGHCLFGIAILSQILAAGHWLAVGGSQIPAATLPKLQAGFDIGMRAGIVLTMIGLAVRAGLEGWRGYRAAQADRLAVAA